MVSGKTLNMKASGVVAIAVMCSCFLGLIREVIFNVVFGASSMGIFHIAFRAPNLLRDLFAEGVLSISFITVLSKKIEMEGDASAWALASKMITFSAVMMSILSLLAIIFPRELVVMLAPGFSPEDVNIAVQLTRIMYPFMLLTSLAALAMGILNTKNVFGIPALAPSFFNIASIVGGIACGWLIDHHFGVKALTGLAIGTLLGGLFQIGIQIPSLRRIGFHFRPDFRWNDPGIRSILILTIPGIIAASVVQINVFINSSYASYFGKEAVTWLNSAFRLILFPIGIFGVAVSTITLPVISRIAATKDYSQFGKTLGRALRFTVFLTMPAAVGLWFFSVPIIKIIYEYGKFYNEDSMQTALALQYYVIGLVAYSCITVLAPSFYAINRKWTPMLVSFLAVAINIFLSHFLIMTLKMDHCGLALSMAISGTINFITLYILMASSHNLQSIYFFSYALRCAIASMVLGVVCWLLLNTFSDLINNTSFWIRGGSLLIAILLAGMSYLLTCLILQLDAASKIFDIIFKKLTYVTV